MSIFQGLRWTENEIYDLKLPGGKTAKVLPPSSKWGDVMRTELGDVTNRVAAGMFGQGRG